MENDGTNEPTTINNIGKLDKPPVMIEKDGDLERAIRRWERRVAIGLDTEFIRVKTFYQIIGLIQVSDGNDNYLIDPISVKDLRPFYDLLRNERVIKVFHSCSEDLEVFYHLCGCLPRPIFDTQIAAAFTGHGYPVSYQKLVEDLYEIHIPKHQTRTDWIQRPLSADQVEYGALDVAYLLRAFRVLRGRLRRSNRESWAVEEFEKLDDPSRFIPDDGNYYRNVKGAGRLRPRELAVLRSLAAWREKEARRRDWPRNFVLQDSVLVVLAEKQPSTIRELKPTHGIGRRTLKRDGENILRLVREGLAVPNERLPEPLNQSHDMLRYKRRMEAARDFITRTAEELNIPKEFIAPRSVVSKLFKHSLVYRKPGFPEELQGWRAKVLGEGLLSIIHDKGFGGSRP